ncbi:aminotransferase class I/II-fold pyridoxal phosphate-dependent enzyme [Thermomicrobiaceae bacterium CFH 74404]|uniref:Aminotransferase class I/II-fold pyridoxal phosphate-dependent enzyme n=1 Tax=Thermalbibacter longus TaxID=2951981 RepID=A0AA41WD11_9BACT|nr:aminotransferase class I/II-fold pyridoxal phosphate-dependent enzyme [Thermalbibacter longus]MCM8748808.1 aminotransferase class I/II-fold pyridoxal phosphate-dependent enzyme [Thermalbibacter longus]
MWERDAPEEMGDLTRCAHGGEDLLPSATDPLTPPIWQTAAYAYPDLDTLDAIYEGRERGFIYGRYGLPNHVQLERALADLEGAEAALATASGMSAISSLLFALLAPGDRVVASELVYRGTRNLLDLDLARFGVIVEYVDATDLAAVEASLQRPGQPPRLLYVDFLTNPTILVHDVPSLAELAHRHGALLVVDSTFATPYHGRPIQLGADLVVHSTTKFIAGHHDVSGGAVVGRSELVERARRQAIRMGGIGGPFDAWLALRGLRTLALRMGQSSRSALALASRLVEHPAVERVSYPGLPGHPQHDLARGLLANGFGSMLAFEVEGGRAAVARLVRALRLIRFAETLGGVTTTIVHPASTSHRSVEQAARAAHGIGEGLLRLSVGIETTEDLVEDLERGLASLA